jgi:hypothetical protein
MAKNQNQAGPEVKETAMNRFMNSWQKLKESMGSSLLRLVLINDAHTGGYLNKVQKLSGGTLFGSDYNDITNGNSENGLLGSGSEEPAALKSISNVLSKVDEKNQDFGEKFFLKSKALGQELENFIKDVRDNTFGVLEEVSNEAGKIYKGHQGELFRSTGKFFKIFDLVSKTYKFSYSTDRIRTGAEIIGSLSGGAIGGAIGGPLGALIGSCAGEEIAGIAVDEGRYAANKIKQSGNIVKTVFELGGRLGGLVSELSPIAPYTYDIQDRKLKKLLDRDTGELIGSRFYDDLSGFMGKLNSFNYNISPNQTIEMMYPTLDGVSKSYSDYILNNNQNVNQNVSLNVNVNSQGDGSRLAEDITRTIIAKITNVFQNTVPA